MVELFQCPNCNKNFGIERSYLRHITKKYACIGTNLDIHVGDITADIMKNMHNSQKIMIDIMQMQKDLVVLQNKIDLLVNKSKNKLFN